TPAARSQHDRHRNEGQRALLEEDLAIVPRQFAQDRLDDFAALAPSGPFVEPPLIVHQRHAAVAWVSAQRALALRGPVIAAALDQTAIGGAMDLEYGYPIDASSDPK